jgi:CRISPR/Cas system-associated exonuclease Cas4 (RecB family)
MADTFIHVVAKDVLTRFEGRVENTVVIFPNKRPALYFLRALEQNDRYSGKPPAFYTIDDFISGNSRYKLAESLDLLVILYKIYLKYYPDTDFDSFFGWGNLMLNDYDDIDRYLADAGRLFKNLSAAKDIETYFMKDFSLPDEFLSPLNPHDEYYLQQKFMETWQVYEKCYFELKKELNLRGLAYSGMIYRDFAENISSRQIAPAAVKYIFIGFNALSKSEEQIIGHLVGIDKALIYWDADQNFFNNSRENSGYFIRKHMQQLKGYNPQLFGNQLLTGTKNIRITAAPQQVGQAKALADAIKKDQQADYSGTTVIVLPDENLLSPLMASLALDNQEVNVTPGYPLTFSNLYGLFQALIKLQENYRPESKSFYLKDVLALFSHPTLRKLFGEAARKNSEFIVLNQLIYIPKHLLEQKEATGLNIFFQPIEDHSRLSAWIVEIIAFISPYIPEDNQESEALIAFDEIFKSLDALIRSAEIPIGIKAFKRLVREKMGQVKLSHATDQPEALQIMGILETRCLDFDNVYMLSVNEGTLPAPVQNHSYIPFDLRKAFNLPTPDEQDHLFAYNFFRLLPGAKNIHLFYNSETGTGSAEKSRYIRQIEYFLPKENPKINISHHTFTFPLRTQPAKEIVITKDEAFSAALIKKNESGFSPSYIASYFICPLQFYFNHIAGIPQKEEVTEDLEARHFGTLFHALMEQSYKNLKGQTITAAMVSDRKSRLHMDMETALNDLHKSQKEFILQKNSLIVETVKVLAEKTLDADMEYAPFKLIDLEKEIKINIPFSEGGLKNITLKGMIDRIDEKDGVVRIVDYKTGSVKKYEFNLTDPEEMLNKDNKEAFQTIYYSFLYYSEHPGTLLQPVIMPLKEVVKGYKEINKADGNLSEKHFNLFFEKLKSIILAILDPATPMIQTTELNICANCSYRNICLR